MLNALIGFVGKRWFPIRYARWLGVQVGECCRLIKCEFSTEPYLVRIGNHVSATSVRFETHDGGVWCIRHQHPDLDLIRPIVVGNNVYIGYEAVILPGTVIGDNVIVGARAVVRGHVPANTVYAGVPAKFIKRLDDYSLKALRDGTMTKSLPVADKRTFLLRKCWPKE